MARSPKDILATDFRVSPKKNLREKLWRHIIWQNHFPQHWRQVQSQRPFSATYHGGRHL